MRRGLSIALLLTLGLAPCGMAQKAGEEAVAPQVLAAAVAELNTTLREIRDLLARQIEPQGLDLLFKRVEFTAARSAGLEARLRSVEEARRGADEERHRMEGMLEAVREEMAREGVEAETLRQQERQVLEEIRRMGERVSDLDAESVLLGNRLADERRELEGWQDLLDRQLAAPR